MIPGIETDLPGRTPHETGRKPHYTGARARDALVTLARLLGVSLVRVFFLSHKFFIESEPCRTLVQAQSFLSGGDFS